MGVFRIPTDTPESDGTHAWTATTMVVVEVSAGRATGLGYTYSDAGVQRLIADQLAPVVRGRDAMDVTGTWHAMIASLRNLGAVGPGAAAVSAVDVALWDLKSRLLGISLVSLLGACRSRLPVYGSGGFTSYDDAQVRRQFEGWAGLGITRFKMKVGRVPEADLARGRKARAAIGPVAELFMDANSAYTRKQALEFARLFAGELGVTWLEQPLPPEDLDGLRELRRRVPAPLEIADGEYAYELDTFRRMLAAEAVDVMMADVTRCRGITGFLQAAVLCEAAHIPLSSHCAPALHLAPGCAAGPMRHAEYFHDHVRIERMLLEGVPEVREGCLTPDRGRPGHGLEFKWADAEPFAA